MVSQNLHRTARLFAAPLALLAVACTARASDVVEIIEHWELSVGGPETAISAPQVTMVMSPTGHTDGDYFVVTLNHWTSPNFAPGGVQIQHWNGETARRDDGASTTSPLHHDGETVSWKQRLSVENGDLVFELQDGQSESWGTFGNGDLRMNVGSSVNRLNDYLPAVSLNESGIGYAGNRVSSLVLTKLQWRFAGESTFHEMVAPIDIDADLDP